MARCKPHSLIPKRGVGGGVGHYLAARLAGTDLALLRDAVVARPGGPELQGDTSRRVHAHFRRRRVRSPSPKPSSLRRAGLPGVGLILREIPHVYMTF
jgi:hypothetical protein